MGEHSCSQKLNDKGIREKDNCVFYSAWDFLKKKKSLLFIQHQIRKLYAKAFQKCLLIPTQLCSAVRNYVHNS